MCEKKKKLYIWNRHVWSKHAWKKSKGFFFVCWWGGFYGENKTKSQLKNSHLDVQRETIEDIVGKEKGYTMGKFVSHVNFWLWIEPVRLLFPPLSQPALNAVERKALFFFLTSHRTEIVLRGKFCPGFMIGSEKKRWENKGGWINLEKVHKVYFFLCIWIKGCLQHQLTFGFLLHTPP